MWAVWRENRLARAVQLVEVGGKLGIPRMKVQHCAQPCSVGGLKDVCEQAEVPEAGEQRR